MIEKKQLNPARIIANQKGYTESSLARKIDLPAGTVHSSFKRSVDRWSVKTLKLVASALEMSLDELYDKLKEIEGEQNGK